jgi:hypothetical protein
MPVYRTGSHATQAKENGRYQARKGSIAAVVIFQPAIPPYFWSSTSRGGMALPSR